MSAHTPGPWAHLPNTSASVFKGDLQIAACDGLVPHDGFDCRVQCPHERRANADLIAAAPDLLAFAREVASDSWGCPLPHGLAAWAERVVAKAEGRLDAIGGAS